MKKTVFNKEYFKNRFLNDNKRIQSFKSEKEFIFSHIKKGTICDVGCSTGEMLSAFNWNGKQYGMEISSYAKNQAIESGISFEKDIFNSKDYFDIVIFRGTIQHIDTPFLYMKKCHESLKDDGMLVFLATPNTNSLYFKMWNTLPFLDYPESNYFIPNDEWLINAAKNIGFELVEIRYPYFYSPYSNFFLDHIKFILKAIGFKKLKFAFWHNSMDIILRKKNV